MLGTEEPILVVRKDAGAFRADGVLDIRRGPERPEDAADGKKRPSAA